jgi:hypothetical protein
MTREELIRLATRLTHGPVPTPHKKVYGYQGNLRLLLEVLPPAITVQMRVSDACNSNDLQDLATARDILKTLFLWHCAFTEPPRGMTASDLAEACLADHDLLKKEDHIEFTLGRMRDNQVID